LASSTDRKVARKKGMLWGLKCKRLLVQSVTVDAAAKEVDVVRRGRLTGRKSPFQDALQSYRLG
jgi:hypothetical protein